MKSQKQSRIISILFFVLLVLAATFILKSSYFSPASTSTAEVVPNREDSNLKLRPPVVAGQFYSASREKLSKDVEGFLKTVNPEVSNTRAIIVPHAGYMYSGAVAGVGYKALDETFKKIFILASNHSSNASPFKFSIPDYTHYQSPLGKVKVSNIATTLLKEELFSFEPQVHSTHIIEVHLPFLQKMFADFEVIPIITGLVNAQDLEKAAKIISQHLDDDSLLVISSDLSHYHPYEKAKELDTACIKALESGDLLASGRCEACGLPAALILLHIAAERGWKGKILDYKNSGDTAGSKDSVVGYTAIAFYEEVLSAKDKQALLELSKKVLHEHVKNNKRISVDESLLSKELLEKKGCFVTLNKDHALRGCIGHLEAREPLHQCIVENTINAASNDGRFKPVVQDELKDIDIEISVLTVPKLLSRKNPQALLDFLKPLKHGLILKQGWRQSTFLPQVWEQLPKKEVFLSRLCLKGGLPQDCWKDPKTQIFVYEAIVF